VVEQAHRFTGNATLSQTKCIQIWVRPFPQHVDRTVQPHSNAGYQNDLERKYPRITMNSQAPFLPDVLDIVSDKYDNHLQAGKPVPACNPLNFNPF
jgi:hypothetical protein